MKFLFSKAQLVELKADPKRRIFHSDTKVRGLQISIQPSGTKKFFLNRRIGDRVEKLPLGPFPDLSLEAARRKAEQLNAQIAEGKNPADDRRTERDRETLGELFELFVERHAKPHKRSWRGDLSLWNGYLKRFANRRISDLKRRDFASLHAEISKTHPVVANRVLSLLSAIFGRAHAWGIWEGTNPCKGISANREIARSRFLRGNELRRFLFALEDEPCETTHDVLLTALLTGARQANVLQMRWSEIDFEEREWQIPGAKFKTGESQSIPLQPDAVAILQRRRETTQSPWVFPALRSDSKTGYFTGIAVAWKRIVLRTEAIGLAEMIAERTKDTVETVKERIWNQIEASRSKHAMKRSRLSATDAVMDALRTEVAALGLDPEIARVVDLRMHDLRRTLASWQVKTGASLYVTARTLGQKDLKTTMTYARLDLGPIRLAMETAGAAMMAVARPRGTQISPPTNKDDAP